MKLEHVALASNSEIESDKFFIELLGCEKTRSFTVSNDLMEQFFEVSKEQPVVRYEKDSVSFEVFITQDNSMARDTFTHACIVVENRDELLKKANSMNLKTIKVPRKNSDSYYLFIKDFWGNMWEVK